jgi:uncharacterized GH25 family protein
MRNVAVIIAIGLLLCCSGRSWAHAIWIDGAGKTYRIVYGGHGENAERYDPAKVVMVRAFDDKGKPVACSKKEKARGVELSPAAGAVAIIARLDNGYWIKEGGRWIQGTKREHPRAAAAEHTIKETAYVRSWSPTLAKPLGLELALIPIDAACGTPAAHVRVQALWRGKPLPKAKVFYEHDKYREADKRGIAEVPCPRRGDAVIEVEHALPAVADLDTNDVVYSSTLVMPVHVSD